MGINLPREIVDIYRWGKFVNIKWSVISAFFIVCLFLTFKEHLKCFMDLSPTDKFLSEWRVLPASESLHIQLVEVSFGKSKDSS